MCKSESIICDYTHFVRILAIVGAVVSLFVFIELLFENTKEDGNAEYALLLGINVAEFDLNEDRNLNTTSGIFNQLNGEYYLMWCSAFAFCDFISNFILIIATLKKEVCSTLPWLALKTISLLVQFTGFVYYLVQSDKKDVGILTSAFINFAITIILWYIVYKTQKSWRQRPEDEERILQEEQNGEEELLEENLEEIEDNANFS